MIIRTCVTPHTLRGWVVCLLFCCVTISCGRSPFNIADIDASTLSEEWSWPEGNDSDAQGITTMPEDVAPDTVMADTAVADTAVADTAVADTFIGDTFMADTVSAEDTLPDTRPIEDTTRTPDTQVVEDSTLPEDTSIPIDTSIPMDTLVMEDSTPPEDSTLPEDTSVPIDTSIPMDTASEDTSEPIDTRPQDTAPSDTDIAVDTAVPLDTEVMEDSTPPEDTSLPMDTSIPIDTLVMEDSAPPEDSTPPEDTSLPMDTSPPEDTSVPEDTFTPEDTEVADTDSGPLFPDCTQDPLDASCSDQAGRIGLWAILGSYSYGGCGARFDDVWDPSQTAQLGETATEGRRWALYLAGRWPDGRWRSNCTSLGCNNEALSVDFNCHYSNNASPTGSPDQVMAYAQTMIHLDAPRRIRLHISADDGYRVWLNGDPIMGNVDNCRCYGGDHEIYDVDLDAGDHRVLIQVGDRTGHWGFTFRVTSEGQPVQGLNAWLP